MAEDRIDLLSIPAITVDTNGYGWALDIEQFIALTSNYTLTSQTAAQKLFNSSTNGQLTVLGSTAYFFECQFALSSMVNGTTSFGFAIGGTATLTSIAWSSIAAKVSSLTAPSTSFTSEQTYNTTASNTALTASISSAANAICFIKGIIRINAAGTIIPQVSLGAAAAAIVQANSFFRIWPCGGPLDGFQNVGFCGPWT